MTYRFSPYKIWLLFHIEKLCKLKLLLYRESIIRKCSFKQMYLFVYLFIISNVFTCGPPFKLLVIIQTVYFSRTVSLENILLFWKESLFYIPFLPNFKIKEKGFLSVKNDFRVLFICFCLICVCHQKCSVTFYKCYSLRFSSCLMKQIHNLWVVLYISQVY